MMIDTIILREYDSITVKKYRDYSKKIISQEDAILLQNIVMNDSPVFKWNSRKITAQHWVGVISLKNLNIEIVPKLYGYIDTRQLKDVLIKMLLISHQDPFLSNLPGNVDLKKNSLLEILIANFIESIVFYIDGGMLHSYRKINRNIRYIKGRILFNKQFVKNVLNPVKFWCRYSKFTINNSVNQFLKTCVNYMLLATNDYGNRKQLKFIMSLLEYIDSVTKEKALSLKITFNSTNYQAEKSYKWGKLFLENIFTTINAGGERVNVMLFDMNSV